MLSTDDGGEIENRKWRVDNWGFRDAGRVIHDE